MTRNTLFEHKETTITQEENMINANNYHLLTLKQVHGVSNKEPFMDVSPKEPTPES
jgi:hypothetical protein